VVHKTPVDGATIEGTLVGTPSYMSPEQAMGKSALDQRADLWSLGVIVYRALTGGRPFESESFGELVVQICGQDPVPPTQRAPGVPPGVDAFIARALERDPAKRFQSAREMGRAFLAIVPGASPVATAWTDDRATPVNSDDPPSRIQVSESSSKRLNAAPPSSHGVDATGPAPSISMTSAPPSGSMGSAPSGSFGSAPRLGAAPGAMNGMAAYGAPPWAPSYTPAPDARPRRPSPIAAVLGCFAGFGLVGALLVGFSYHRAAKRSAEPEIVSAAASLSAAPSVATVPIVSVPEAAKEAPTIAPIAAPPPTGLAEKAPPSAATPPPGARPRSIPRAASTAKHVDCSSPYYYNSEGTKFIKPECL
jgi:serine/threonine-protein kinase